MLAYEDKAGKFKLTKYGYLSKGGNEHLDERALELDHYPPWNKRLKSTRKMARASPTGVPIIRMSLSYEHSALSATGITSSNERLIFRITTATPRISIRSRTPKHETQYNTGAWSGIATQFG